LSPAVSGDFGVPLAHDWRTRLSERLLLSSLDLIRLVVKIAVLLARIIVDCATASAQ